MAGLVPGLAMTCKDFVLQIKRASSGRLMAQVTESPGGSGSVELNEEALFALAVPQAHGPANRDGELRDVVVADRRRPPSRRELGHRLFDLVFAGDVRSRYDTSVGVIEAEHQVGLRIRIQMDLEDTGLAHLHSLPWEYLSATDDDCHPLALRKKISIVRDVLGPRPQRQPAKARFRVLAVASEPRGAPVLELAQERRHLEAAWRRKGIEFLWGASLAEIRRVVQQGDFHILHFMGHGHFDAGSNEGSLLLENDAGEPAPMDGPGLAIQLDDIPSLRLVVLNACQTAHAATVKPFGGLATALLKAGIPAVVAMQLPISDAAAICFGGTFYRYLAKGESIDAAVTEGRIALSGRFRDSEDWGIPALFLRAGDGTLVSISNGRFRRMAWTLPMVFLFALGGFVRFDRRASELPNATAFRAAPIAQPLVLRGEILDATTGNPLPGVVVQLPELRFQAISDGLGQYRFEIPSRVSTLVKLRATLVGYTPLNLDLTPGSGHLNAHRMMRTR